MSCGFPEVFSVELEQAGNTSIVAIPHIAMAFESAVIGNSSHAPNGLRGR
jgi:hypothetical protein